MSESNGPEVNAGNAPVSSLMKIRIAEMIEYFFGDFNLMKNGYMNEERAKDNGWVPISTLLQCNRLASLSKDVDLILSSLKENASSVIEIDSERQCVRRNPEITIPENNEAWRSSVADRTVYAGGFPRETMTLDDVQNFMLAFGKIDYISKRPFRDKVSREWKFEGSYYITFPTKEEAAKFVDIKSVKYDGNEIFRKWQNDHIKEMEGRPIIKHKRISEESRNWLETLAELPTGALIALRGLTSEITPDDLRKFGTQNEWRIAFIDYSIGDSDAYVQLKNADSARNVLSKLKDGSFVIKEISIKAEIVEGEKEIEVLNKMESERNFYYLKCEEKNRKTRRENGKPDGASGPRDDADRENSATDETNDSKDGIVSESMKVEASVISSGDGTADMKPTVVVTAPDGKSVETNGDNEKPGSSGESTLKRKTERTFPETTKKIKLEPSD